jgi:hypothetical protein
VNLFYRLAIAILLGMQLTGCAVMPESMYAEVEHVSHPFAGPPFGPRTEEDTLNMINVGGTWSKDNVYMDVGLGYKFTDSGFHGPPLSFDMRVGYRIPLKKE